jgi:para-nitrobenzyl esterase
VSKSCQITIALVLASLVVGGCTKKEAEEPAQTSTPAVDQTAAPAPAASDSAGLASPVGNAWKWESTQTPVERFTPDDPSRYTVEFLPDSTLVAQLDCNRGHGRYRMDGQSIEIPPFAITRAMCPPGSLGDQFAKQLNAGRHWFFRGDTLYIDLFADSGTMKFSKQ